MADFIWKLQQFGNPRDRTFTLDILHNEIHAPLHFSGTPTQLRQLVMANISESLSRQALLNDVDALLIGDTSYKDNRHKKLSSTPSNPNNTPPDWLSTLEFD